MPFDASVASVVKWSQHIIRKLRSDDAVLRQGYARRFIDKVVLAPDIITIKPLEIAVGGEPDH